MFSGLNPRQAVPGGGFYMCGGDSRDMHPVYPHKIDKCPFIIYYIHYDS